MRKGEEEGGEKKDAGVRNTVQFVNLCAANSEILAVKQSSRGPHPVRCKRPPVLMKQHLTLKSSECALSLQELKDGGCLCTVNKHPPQVHRPPVLRLNTKGRKRTHAHSWPSELPVLLWA